MPAETFTKTALQVADQVKRQFGDPDGRQITNADILGWINIAQQDIVTQNPMLKDTLQTTAVVGQDLYTFPTDEIQYIEAIHFNGLPLQAYTFQEAQAYLLDEPAGTVSTQAPRIWYERDGNVYLYPPPSEAKSIRMFYVKRPTDLTSMTDLLTIPDRYFQRLLDLVLARSYQLDENWEAAQYKQQEFAIGMTQMANQENINQTNLYPAIFTRPEDL